MARMGVVCKPDLARVVTQKNTGRAHHFRTPSPDGQQALPRVLLPVFFDPNFRFESVNWRAFADHQDVNGKDWKTSPYLSSVLAKEQSDTGANKCLSKYGQSSLRPPLASLRAGTLSRTKPLSVVLRVPVRRSLRTVACSKVRPSVPLVIHCIAKPTHENVADANAQQRVVSGLRRRKSRQHVLYCTQWASKAQSRGKYNETSNLHFCSVSRHVGWRMHQAGHIQSRHHIVVGPTGWTFDSRVIERPYGAASPSNIASTVPFIRGGQMRSSIQITGDCICSKRS
jgi:hypothetical protein